MQYMAGLKKKSYSKDNEWFDFQDSLLAPDSDFDFMLAENCDARGLCDKCNCNSIGHIMRKIGKNTYDKLCPILFIDMVNPPFKIGDLV